MAGRHIGIGVGVPLLGALIGFIIGWVWASSNMPHEAISFGLALFPMFIGAMIGFAVGAWIANLWMR